MTQKDKKIELDALKVRKKAEIPEFDLTRFQEDHSHMELEKCCGNCCWFYGEDSYGWGFCICQKEKCNGLDLMACSDLCTTDEYVSRQEMRHHMAVLLQTNRYRRDDNVPSIYRMPNPKEIGKAIDFSYEYMKKFSEL